MAAWSINNSQTKKYFLLRICLEKAVFTFPVFSHNCNCGVLYSKTTLQFVSGPCLLEPAESVLVFKHERTFIAVINVCVYVYSNQPI
jgi:hypothetical protein